MIDHENRTILDTLAEMRDALLWALDQIEDDLDPNHQAALAAAHQLVAHAKGIV